MVPLWSQGDAFMAFLFSYTTLILLLVLAALFVICYRDASSSPEDDRDG